MASCPPLVEVHGTHRQTPSAMTSLNRHTTIADSERFLHGHMNTGSRAHHTRPQVESKDADPHPPIKIHGPLANTILKGNPCTNKKKQPAYYRDNTCKNTGTCAQNLHHHPQKRKDLTPPKMQGSGQKRKEFCPPKLQGKNARKKRKDLKRQGLEGQG